MNRPYLFRFILTALIPAAAISLSPSDVSVSGVLFSSARAQSGPSPAPSVNPSPEPSAPPAPATNAAPEAAPPSSSPPAPPAAAETPSATSPVTTTDPFGEEQTLEPRKVLMTKGTASWDSAFDALMESFKALSAVLDKENIKPSGNPMIVYTSTDDNGFAYLAQIPIDQDPKNLPKDISIGKSPEGKALKFVHRGSYDSMDNTYEAITNHLDEKKLEAKDTFIEEYLTDPLKTNEDKLVINVYVPLK